MRTSHALIPLALALAIGALPACQTSSDETGVSDESALETQLTPEEQAAFDAIDAAIARLGTTLMVLRWEIGDLEDDNAKKAQEIASLVSQLELRKQEVRDNYEDKRDFGFFACALGYCDVGAVSLAMALDDDARLRQLNQDLAAAKASQAKITAALDAYAEKKAEAERLLAALTAQEKTLRDAYQGKGHVPKGYGANLFAAQPTLPRVAQRSFAGQGLVDNLEAQKELLEDLLAVAGAINAEASAALASVKTASLKADALKAASDKAFYDLVKIVAADDPHAAASEWLDKAVQDKTKAVMKQLGVTKWLPDTFVKHLIKESFPGKESSVAAKTMAQQLTTELEY